MNTLIRAHLVLSRKAHDYLLDASKDTLQLCKNHAQYAPELRNTGKLCPSNQLPKMTPLDYYLAINRAEQDGFPHLAAALVQLFRSAFPELGVGS